MNEAIQTQKWPEGRLQRAAVHPAGRITRGLGGSWFIRRDAGSTLKVSQDLGL